MYEEPSDDSEEAMSHSSSDADVGSRRTVASSRPRRSSAARAGRLTAAMTASLAAASTAAAAPTRATRSTPRTGAGKRMKALVAEEDNADLIAAITSEAPSAFSQSTNDHAGVSLARLRQKKPAQASNTVPGAAAAAAAVGAAAVEASKPATAEEKRVMKRSMWHVYIAYQIFHIQREEIAVRVPCVVCMFLMCDV